MALTLYRPVFWAALILLGILLLLLALRRRLRWWPAFILRIFLVGLILLGIFTPRAEFLRSSIPDREVAIIDLSDSVSDEARQNALAAGIEWQKQSAGRLLLVYGDETRVIYPDEASWPELDGRANSLAEALDLAGNMLGTSPGKIILATDGLVPQTDAIQAALQAVIEAGHRVDWLPLQGRDFSQDSYLGQLWAPRNLWRGMPFYVVLPVYAHVPLDEIVFRLMVNRVEVEATQEITGESYVEFQVPPQAEGIVTLEVYAEIPADPVQENNASFLTVQVHSEPQVLFVSGGSDSPEMLALLESMSHKGIQVDQTTADGLPTSLEGITNYQVIFLDNLLAGDLTQEQMLSLRLFVSRLGGGLVFLGGRNSYTLGGYKNSLLEPMLPVKLEPPPRPERPPMAFLLVIDHSSSMSAGSDTLEPIDLAREAAMRAVENLKADDYLGVLIFNNGHDWTVPLRQLGSGLDLRIALDAISRIDATGGTKMYAAMGEAISQARALTEMTQSEVSVLLLSDGDSWDGNLDAFTEQASNARAQNITISTIAFGVEADTETMEAIATNGMGRYYQVLAANDLPTIMVQESEAIRGENIQVGVTNLMMSSDNPDHPILTGLSLGHLPLLNSYNALTSKSDEGAEDVLVSANFGDPLLSVWQYGLGRVVAWMGDDGGEWTESWTSSEAQGIFWSQVVRYAIPQPGLEPASVEIITDETALTVSATVMDDSIPDGEHYINLSEVKFSYAQPDGAITTYLLPQSAPGRYQLEIPRPAAGAYRAVLEYSTPAGEDRVVPVLLEINTPLEWLPIQAGETSLVDMDALTAQTGGQTISMEMLSVVGEEDPAKVDRPAASTGEWWWYILLALIILWPLEILIRRRYLPWM